MRALSTALFLAATTLAGAQVSETPGGGAGGVPPALAGGGSDGLPPPALADDGFVSTSNKSTAQSDLRVVWWIRGEAFAVRPNMREGLALQTVIRTERFTAEIVTFHTNARPRQETLDRHHIYVDLVMQKQSLFTGSNDCSCGGYTAFMCTHVTSWIEVVTKPVPPASAPDCYTYEDFQAELEKWTPPLPPKTTSMQMTSPKTGDFHSIGWDTMPNIPTSPYPYTHDKATTPGPSPVEAWTPQSGPPAQQTQGFWPPPGVYDWDEPYDARWQSPEDLHRARDRAFRAELEKWTPAQPPSPNP